MIPEIRLAGAGSVRQMAAIERVSFPSPWSESQLLRCVRVSDVSRTWLAVKGEDVLGYVCVVTSDLGLLHVANLAVRPGFRGQGIGKLLMETAHGWGARTGACASFLEVREENGKALELYLAMGYRVQTLLRDYYGRGEHGLRCVRELPPDPASGLISSLARAMDRVPGTGVVLGSGLSWVADLFGASRTIDLGELPGYGEETIPGHPGTMAVSGCGRFVFLLGRRHRFQGFDGDEIAGLPGALSDLGTHTWMLTTSSGAVDPSFRVGDAMVFEDHVNLSGCVPSGRQGLTGEGVYSRRLRETAAEAARSTGCPVHLGTFASVTGPAYETPAEVELLRKGGVSAVSMSTAQEALLLSSRGCRVLGLATVTNSLAADPFVKHEDVLSAQDTVRSKQEAFVRRLLDRVSVDGLR